MLLVARRRRDPVEAEAALERRKKFGKRLAKLRKAAKLSQEQAALISRMPVSTLQTWEQGKVSATHDDLLALADALGQPLEVLEQDPEAPVPPPDPKRFRAFRLEIHPLAEVDEPLLREAHQRIAELNAKYLSHTRMAERVIGRTQSRK